MTYDYRYIESQIQGGFNHGGGDSFGMFRMRCWPCNTTGRNSRRGRDVQRLFDLLRARKGIRLNVVFDSGCAN
jgi:hypothetical protein